MWGEVRATSHDLRVAPEHLRRFAGSELLVVGFRQAPTLAKEDDGGPTWAFEHPRDSFTDKAVLDLRAPSGDAPRRRAVSAFR